MKKKNLISLIVVVLFILMLIPLSVQVKRGTADEKKEQGNAGGIVLEAGAKTSKGATFIIKNPTGDEYCYGQPYLIERFENEAWRELDTLTGAPLSWNAVLYPLKAGEEKELYIDWSSVYGELKSGRYRLVKNDLRKSASPESRTYTLYAAFDIK